MTVGGADADAAQRAFSHTSPIHISVVLLPKESQQDAAQAPPSEAAKKGQVRLSPLAKEAHPFKGVRFTLGIPPKKGAPCIKCISFVIEEFPEDLREEEQSSRAAGHRQHAVRPGGQAQVSQSQAQHRRR